MEVEAPSSTEVWPALSALFCKVVLGDPRLPLPPMLALNTDLMVRRAPTSPCAGGGAGPGGGFPEGIVPESGAPAEVLLLMLLMVVVVVVVVVVEVDGSVLEGVEEDAPMEGRRGGGRALVVVVVVVAGVAVCGGEEVDTRALGGLTDGGPDGDGVAAKVGCPTRLAPTGTPKSERSRCGEGAAAVELPGCNKAAACCSCKFEYAKKEASRRGGLTE